MGHRLWASLCAFIAFITLVAGSGAVIDPLAHAARRSDELRSNIAALQAPAAVCVAGGGSYGYGPSVRKLLTVFQGNKETGLVSTEIGSIDEGQSWKELRRFDPPVKREGLERLGAAGTLDGKKPLTAQSTLLVAADCAKSFAHELDAVQAARLPGASAAAATTVAGLLFIWFVYRWGLWLVRGTWRTRA